MQAGRQRGRWVRLVGSAAAGSVVLAAGVSGGFGITVASAAQAPVDGGVIAWGNNDRNQVAPMPVEASSGVTAVSAGGAHSLALKQDGSVIGWGDPAYGAAVIPDAAKSGVTAIAATDFSSLAVKDGGVIGWGDNSFGQLAIPTEAQSGVTAVAAGGGQGLALKQDGSVVGWNTYVPAEAKSGVTAISAGKRHALALKDGAVIGWGDNTYEQIAVPDAAKSGVTAISAGDYFSLALKDGGVIGWGNNSNPTDVIPDTVKSGVIAIDAGADFALALKQDGSVVGWGDTYYYETPVPDSLKSGITAISAGDYFGLAVKLNPAPAAITGQAPAGMVGTAYSYDYQLAGTPVATATVTGGSLPPGLTLTGQGLLSGTPTTAGSYTFTITATNGVGAVATVDNTVVISPAATPNKADLVVKVTAPTTGKIGQPYTYTVTVKNQGPAAAKNVVTSLVIPDGTQLVSATGSPTRVRQVIIWAAPTIGNGATVTYTVTVKPTGKGTRTAYGITGSTVTPDPTLASNTAKGTTTIK